MNNTDTLGTCGLGSDGLCQAPNPAPPGMTMCASSPVDIWYCVPCASGVMCSLPNEGPEMCSTPGGYSVAYPCSVPIPPEQAPAPTPTPAPAPTPTPAPAPTPTPGPSPSQSTDGSGLTSNSRSECPEPICETNLEVPGLDEIKLTFSLSEDFFLATNYVATIAVVWTTQNGQTHQGSKAYGSTLAFRDSWEGTLSSDRKM